MELYKEKIEVQSWKGTYNENYKVFIPDNVNENTEIIFYTCNIVFDEEMQQDILNNNKNAIVVVPHNSPAIVGNENSSHSYQEGAIGVFNKLKEEYNLNTTNYTQAGFSSGYGPAIRTMADYIKQNPDAERQILISVDGCESATSRGFPIYKSEYEALKNNNTIIISYAQKYRQNHEIRFLKESGLPILFVVDPDIPENSKNRWSYYHDVVANNFTSRGLYEVLNDWALGKGELPEGYIYQIYNPATQQVENIDRNQVAAFFGINTYETKINKLHSLNKLTIEDMAITSDSAILLKHINNIIGNIKGSSFVQNGTNHNSSFNSTTNVPSKIPESIQKYYDTTATLLIKLSDEIYEFAKVGEIFDKNDQELKQEATELNNIISVSPPISQVNNIDTNESQLTGSNMLNNKEIKVNDENKTNIQNSNEIIKNNNEEKNNESANETQSVEKAKDEEIKQDENKKEEQPKTEIPKNEINEYTEQTKEELTKPDNQNTNNPNNYNNKPTQNITSSNEHLNKIDDFPDYKEVYSDENRIVYDYKDEYRIIVHKTGDEITGIEHYYKFDNENLADKALEMLTDKYKYDNNIENIIQKENYIKVVFKEEVYSNITLADIKNKYKDLNEIFKM